MGPKTINNQIEEPICSREICKLLEEKGFKVKTKANYWILAKDHTENYNKGLPVDESKVFLAKNKAELDQIITISEDEYHNVYHVCPAPTHGLVNEWLRVNFGMWIVIYPLYRKIGLRVDFTLKENWDNMELTNKQYDINCDFAMDTKYQSTQEATEAILKRVLIEMI